MRGEGSKLHKQRYAKIGNGRERAEAAKVAPKKNFPQEAAVGEKIEDKREDTKGVKAKQEEQQNTKMNYEKRMQNAAYALEATCTSVCVRVWVCVCMHHADKSKCCQNVENC